MKGTDVQLSFVKSAKIVCSVFLEAASSKGSRCIHTNPRNGNSETEETLRLYISHQMIASSWTIASAIGGHVVHISIDLLDHAVQNILLDHREIYIQPDRWAAKGSCHQSSPASAL
jgi:hypothetical protein